MKIDHAVYFVQFLIAVLAIWATWKFIRAFVLFRVEESEPAERADDPFAFVGAPVKRGPKGLMEQSHSTNLTMRDSPIASRGLRVNLPSSETPEQL